MHGISHIVNSTGHLPDWHCDKAYHRFVIEDLRHCDAAYMVTRTHQMLSFVRDALRAGKHVLVHCKAGAHRAGTTGIICLMHFVGLPRRDAILIAQRVRQIIDPSSFRDLLEMLEPHL